MRNVSAALLSHLQSGSAFIVAELWEIAPPGKSTLYFTSADNDLVYSGQTYAELDLERGDIEESVGLQVATLDFDVLALDTELVDGLSWPIAALNGYFDEASVNLRLLFLSDWQTQVGAVLLFTGTIAEVEVTLGKVHFTVKSLMEVFNQQFPRNLYQSTCPFLLYDDNCGVVAASYAVSGTVASGSTALLVKDASLTQADDYFAFGYVEFTSGDLSGTRRTVESSTSGQLNLAAPLVQSPGVGNTFTVYPGCDRLQSTCETKFSNDRFGGQPFIPVPETMY